MRVATTPTASISVIRDGNICGGAVDVSPATMNIPGSGGTFAVAVTAPPACAWSLYYPPAWITAATAASGTGSGSVALTFQPATVSYGTNAVIAIGGRAIRIAQYGCEATMQLPADISADGGSIEVPVTAAPGCQWNPVSTSAALGATVLGSLGNGHFWLQAQPNPDPAPRQLTFTMNERPYTLTQRGRTVLRRYLSEGATGSFFSTRLAILNPGDASVGGRLRFQRADGSVRTRSLTVPARGRMTITPESVPDLGSADFATVLESSSPLVLDRTMTWDHPATAVTPRRSLSAPSRDVVSRRGRRRPATSACSTCCRTRTRPRPWSTVTYLLPAGAAPIVRTYSLRPNTRTNILGGRAGPRLDATDVSASSAAAAADHRRARDVPDTRAGQPFAAGHDSAGVTAPATSGSSPKARPAPSSTCSS